MRGPKTLLVEDNADLASEIVFNLRDEGIDAVSVGDAAAMDALMQQAAFDVVVLDIGLPGEDGLSVAHRLADRGDLRLIVLTARSGVDDRIAGLEAGADLYLTKPVDLRELAAAIRRVSRRLPAAGSHWSLDVAAARLSAPGGNSISLTAQECAMLRQVQESPDQIVHRNDLETALWGTTDPSTNRRLEVLVNRLRDKLSRLDEARENPLRTERLKGYRFADRIVRVG